MIIDGRAIAKTVIREAQEKAQGLSRAPSFIAYVIEPSAATLSYLRMKRRQAEVAGIQMTFCELPADTSTEDLVARIQQATEDAIIVQLPLPGHIQLERVLDAIPKEKDADVLSPHTRNDGETLHPIAASVKRILEEAQVPVSGARATVVGHGWLVGKPVASWLREAGAEVTIVTKEEGDIEAAVRTADIIVSGAGSPGLITSDMVSAGAAVIDVGTSELGGSIAGDVDPGVRHRAGVFTPVPGGVGPLAVAYLMKNVIDLAARQGLPNVPNGVH